MATVAQAKPKANRTTSKRTISAKDKLRKAAKSKQLPLAKVFARRDAMVRRGEYELLGRIALLRTELGDVDFGRERGSFIAKLDGTDELVLMNDWQQFPADVVCTTDLCPDCKAHCTGCDGKGERACLGLKCGGEGRMILSYEACSAPGCVRESGKAKVGCEVCKGAGQVPGQTADCPTCKGTKKQQCPQCQASGKMSTGLEGGALPDSAAPRCASCRGTGRKMVSEPQPYQRFVLGEMEGFTVLGPVTELLWQADVCRDPRRSMELASIVADEEGNLGALLVKDPERTGQPWYWLGGKIGPIARL
jgi:hypothetical protein